MIQGEHLPSMCEVLYLIANSVLHPPELVVEDGELGN